MPSPVIDTYFGTLDFDPDEMRRRYTEERDKRLRGDGVAQYVEADAEFASFADDPYTPLEPRKPLHDEVDFAIIGAGFGGLLMAARLREIGIERIRVIDRAGDFGGTWYWNRYPGAMCDVESYCYLPLLEELNYIPRHRYAFAPEILEHSRNIARHYGLYDDACLQTGVTELRFDEARGSWQIETDRGDRMHARYVAMANGPLSKPKLPGIAGINEFRGHIFHTSRWDYGYTGGDSRGDLVNLRDKRVGIVGTGATAVQCIPHLGEWAQSLYVFQRTPSSIDVRGNRPTDPDWAASLQPGWQQARMDNFNTLVSGGDQEEDLVGDGWTDVYRSITGVAAQQASRELGRALSSAERNELMEIADFRKMKKIHARVDRIVQDRATADALKPWYRQLCKQPCFHDEYLATYNRPNVHLVDTHGKGIERLTERAVVVDGKSYELDCLVLATGFEVGTAFTRRAGYDIIGRGGRSLTEHWSPRMRTLHGLTTHGFPNCFFLGFTQTAYTVNVPHALNEQAKHVAYIVDAARRQGHSRIEPSADAEQAYVDEVNRYAHMGAKFYAECTPGYYNSEGAAGNQEGFYSDMHHIGPLKFFEQLAAWRADGGLEGIELSR